MIDVLNLSKDFGDFRAVNDVSFSVERGQVLGFLVLVAELSAEAGRAAH